MNWSCCWIGLGGNLGDLPSAFDRVLELLRREEKIRGVRESTRYTTKPIGGSGASSPVYLNSAVELEIACSLPELLKITQRIESELGRRRGDYWASRTIDLDLLLHEDEQIRTAELTVPHPHLWYRRFVLDPLGELAGAIVHPERGVTIAELRLRLLMRPLICGIHGGEGPSRQKIVEVLSGEFQAVRIVEGGERNSSEEILSLWLGPSSSSENETGEFEQLPRVSRFDVRTISLPAVEAIRQMVRAALGQ